MNFVIPSRDPATTPKTKYEKEIQYSLLKLGPNTSVVAASLRMGNNIKMARRTSHRDRLGLNSRQTLCTWIVVHTYWLKLAWIFLIFNFTIKFWQVIEIIFTLDGFTNFWELLHKKRNSRANCFPSRLLPFPLILSCAHTIFLVKSQLRRKMTLSINSDSTILRFFLSCLKKRFRCFSAYIFLFLRRNWSIKFLKEIMNFHRKSIHFFSLFLQNSLQLWPTRTRRNRFW